MHSDSEPPRSASNEPTIAETRVRQPGELGRALRNSDMPTAPEAGKELGSDEDAWLRRATRAAPLPSVDIGSIIGGKYRLETLIGTGGMGRVFEAVHVELDSRVAIKVMHAYILNLPEHSRRFRREARAASRINHPNVVRILDFGIDVETHYIVMEYVVGTTLGDWLETFAEPPPLAEVYEIAEQVLMGLDGAHVASVVHRDLKPDNILLTTNEHGSRTVKIADFGLARYEDPEDKGASFTRDDTIAGTPGYMSPEQCRSLKVDSSTDLYAFGCILTEMLQLDPPFVAETAIDVISKQLYMPPGPLKRPGNLEPVPYELELLRLDLLSKSPSQRPRSAEEVLFRLRECSSAEALDDTLRTKRASALGVRGDRIPDWNRTGHTWNTDNSQRRLSIQIIRPGAGAGLLEPDLVGLAVQGIFTAELHDDARACVAVVDAGEDRPFAVDTLTGLVGEGRTVVVCLASPTLEDLNTLIEHGAAEVIALPANPETLARRIRRAAKRIPVPGEDQT